MFNRETSDSLHCKHECVLNNVQKMFNRETSDSLHCSYILFSVLFQTKSSLVWKSYTQKLRRIFQTNSSLVWKEKKLILQDTDSKPNSDRFGNFVKALKIPNQIQFGLEISSTNANALVWFGKVTPKNCVRFSKPIPVWFGKIKTDFARHRFQTKFRLVWKILMTIVNVLKIPNQVQFGLEQSLTIANALNLEPIPVLFWKSYFRKGKHSNIQVQD